MNFKKFFMFAALAMGLSVSATAQTEDDGKDYKPYPYMFVGAQGGITNTLTDYSFGKLINPTASVSFGAFFTPVIGARLHVNGGWNKGGIETDLIDETYKYNYITTNLDLMLNLVTLFGKKDYYPLNVYLIGGIGLNTAWGNDEANAIGSTLLTNLWDGTKMSHNARVGAMLDYNISKHFSVNLEFNANSLSDKYNSKSSNADDWQITTMLGVAYKFGYKKKAAPEPIYATRMDTIWYDTTEEKLMAEDGDMTWNVFYKIRESNFEDQIDNDANSQLAAIGKFLAGHKECKVLLKSYADVETGNAKVNMAYSKERSDKAVAALKAAGVPESIITAEYYGDTVQPFPNDNDKNRCTIIYASGIKNYTKSVPVKKFRLQEVSRRVN